MDRLQNPYGSGDFAKELGKVYNLNFKNIGKSIDFKLKVAIEGMKYSLYKYTSTKINSFKMSIDALKSFLSRTKGDSVLDSQTRGGIQELKTQIEANNADGNIVTEIVKQYVLSAIAIVVAINLVSTLIAAYDPQISAEEVKYNGIGGLASSAFNSVQNIFTDLLSYALSIFFSILDEGSDIVGANPATASWEIPLFVLGKVGTSMLNFLKNLGFSIPHYQEAPWGWVVDAVKRLATSALIGLAISSGVGGIGSLIVSMILSNILSFIFIEVP